MAITRCSRPSLVLYLLFGLMLLLLLPSVNWTLNTDELILEKRVLNEFITYFEPIIFEVNESLHKEEKEPGVENTSKFSSSVPLLIDVNAFGTTYKLELKQSSRMLTAGANISVLGGIQECESRRLSTLDIGQHLVEGVVIGDPNSYVHGIFRDGVFTGIIRADNQTIFVEKASKYFNEKVSFDCVVFRLEDLNTTAFDCTMGPEGFKCDPVKLLQRMGPASDVVLPLVESFGRPPTAGEWKQQWARKNPPKNTCRLKLVADHLFYENAGEQTIDNAIYEMIFHVNEADRIFRSTDFDGDGLPDGIGFQVHAIEVHTNTQCQENPTLSKSALSSDQYLELFSEKDFHDFCVGVAFSGHTFPGRVLGIAWMADANSGGYVGGICEPRLYSTQDQKALSFNTAVITMMLEGRKVPRGISAIAVAHELGHSFGSDHDPYQDPICSPGREAGGKYIMAAYAVKGDQPNNRLFSQCSKKSMRSVLRKKSTCFTGASTVCAGMIEENEVCNCANVEACPYLDLCCSSDGEHAVDPQCVYRREIGTPYNPMVEVCCNDECTTVSAEDYKECAADDTHSDDCMVPPICIDVDDDECTVSQPKPDGSSCHMGHGACIGGQCVINPCFERGWETCECPNEADACIVCCRTHLGAECLPARRDEVPWLMLRRPGEPCKNGQGTCNSHGQCDENQPPTKIESGPGIMITGEMESGDSKQWNIWGSTNKEEKQPDKDVGNKESEKKEPEREKISPEILGNPTESHEKQVPPETDGTQNPPDESGKQIPPDINSPHQHEKRGKNFKTTEMGKETGNDGDIEEARDEEEIEINKESVALPLLPEEEMSISEDLIARPEEAPVKEAFVKLLWVLIVVLGILIACLVIMFCCPLMSTGRWCFKQCLGDRVECDIVAGCDPMDQNEVVGAVFYRPMRHAASLDLSHPRYRCEQQQPSAPGSDPQSRSRSY